MDNRNFPDIEFVNADTNTIMEEMIADFERLAERKLYPADPMRVVLNYLANVISHERVIMNEAARQNVPRFASGKYLDSLGEIFGNVTRMQAMPAHTDLEFEISEAQEDGIIIPQGTRVSTDGINFATDKETLIKAGELTVQVPATCEVPGTIGNGFAVGQITACVDIFPFFKAVRNITESGGGADTETDAELYERMRASVDEYSTAGSAGAYAYKVKSSSPLVGDVIVTSPSPGAVDIRFVCKDGSIPNEELLEIARAAVSEDAERPLTDVVRVSPPETVPFDIDIEFWVIDGSGLSLETARAQIEDAVNEYIEWQVTKMKRDIIPERLAKAVMLDGIKRLTINSPTYTAVGENQIAQAGNVKIICGGYEDE